jgi:hypothetical protein
MAPGAAASAVAAAASAAEEDAGVTVWHPSAHVSGEGPLVLKFFRLSDEVFRALVTGVPLCPQFDFEVSRQS